MANKTIRVKMIPHPENFGDAESGIKQVAINYKKYLPQFGVEIIPQDEDKYDLLATHAGVTGADCDIAHVHGLYWTEDYKSSLWQYRINGMVIEAIKNARAVTVPSEWVAESFKRDMHFSPHVIPHGIDWEDWAHNFECSGHILWNKNRAADVCHPRDMVTLAMRNESLDFLTTFSTKDAPNNVKCFERTVPHREMKEYIQTAAVYLSTSKETFGIGTLEAMASGVPVLGYANGGNLLLVKHGVNGYLAQPNNIDDLSAGLAYCLEHRETLGKNGIELSKLWPWERACEMVAEVYRSALEPSPATVSIIIPTYNYGDKVGRAIESAINQTYKQLERIVVVDDGTDDRGATRKVVESFQSRDNRVEYIKQSNQGVAIARNRGISVVSSKYVCCLDADDAIDPEFIEVCVKALEYDRTLGIAYTGLQFLKPDGTTGISQWPDEYDYNLQLKRQNQVPTCCVFRREMWERLGGYRQRYAPRGAGAEDAEFWTRAGAIGYGGRLVTPKPLFIYSWMSGRVTGDPHYQEPDWLGWHPYVIDKRYPFASLADTEVRFSHAVRQYDEPIISVIIPCRVGHRRNVINALDSLEAQGFRRWEAIVVLDGGDPNGTYSSEDQVLTDEFYELSEAFPFVKWRFNNGESKGAGWARNFGVDIAKGNLLMFLDADDWLRPDALKHHYDTWQGDNTIPYANFIGIAIIDNPSQLAKELQENIYEWDEETHRAVIGYRAALYDPVRAVRQPNLEEPHKMPYIWCNVTCLIPRAWHDEIGGFDENLVSWEDVDYHWRMARSGKCYTRIDKELLVYNFHEGGRRDQGLGIHKEIMDYLIDKYKEIPIMPCPAGCGNRRQAVDPREIVRRVVRQSPPQKEEDNLADSDFIMARYLSPNRGRHNVRGPVSGRNYHYRAGGETFLVERRDVEGAPHLFMAVETTRPMPRRVAPPAPVAPPTPVIPATPIIEETTEPEDVPTPVVEVQKPPAPPVPTAMPQTEADVMEAVFDLQTLPGVTTDIAHQMTESGIKDVSDIVELGIEGLMQFKGIADKRATAILDAASRILHEPTI